MGLEVLKQLSSFVNTTVLCLKLLSIKLHHIQLQSCFSAAGPYRCGNWSGGYREYNQYGTRQNPATVSNKDVSPEQFKQQVLFFCPGKNVLYLHLCA